jgi:hypothetical protein
MPLRSYRVVRQIEHSTPQPAQKFAPPAFYPWLEKQRHLAERVVVCYEAGGFGYEPARRMQAMGVEVYVIAPQNWDEQGKRQVNDKFDAQVMCRPPMGTPAPQSQSLSRGPQESHRGAGPSSGGGPVAHGHRTSEGRRTGSCKNNHKVNPPGSLPHRMTLERL